MLRSLPLGPVRHGYASRVGQSLTWVRVAAVALVALLLSLGVLFNPGLLDFYSPAGGGARLARTPAGTAARRRGAAAGLHAGRRGAAAPSAKAAGDAVCLVVCAGRTADAAAARLLRARLPAPAAAAAAAVRFAALGLAGGLPGAGRRRASPRLAHARGSPCRRCRRMPSCCRPRASSSWPLLQAQIEPHFLFNVLGNVRRLYRTQPQAGADTIASLMRYLRAALPQLRSTQRQPGRRTGTGARLPRAVPGAHGRAAAGLDRRRARACTAPSFRRCCCVTLVENAIQHGLEPAGGGHCWCQAVRRRDRLEVAVLDDGAGFWRSAPAAAPGVGLANVRRQLAARYGSAGRLTLEARAAARRQRRCSRSPGATRRCPPRPALAPALRRRPEAHA